MAHAIEHFARLSRLLDLERDEERKRLGEARQTLPLPELEARGLVVLDVEAQEHNVGLGGRSLVKLQRFDGRPLTTQLAAGELVAVSPRKAELDSAPHALVSRATRRWVELAFDRHPPPFVSEGRLRLDLVTNDVTYQRAKGSLDAIAAMETGKLRHRQQVLLGGETPVFEPVKGWEPTRALNPEQHAAVELALAAKDFALVHGPPGTGKSTVLAEIAVQLAKRGQRILGTAASNAAVDHLLELCLDAGLEAVRVGHPARVLPHLAQHTLDLKVEEHPDRIIAREMFEEAFDLLGYARKQRAQGRSRARFSNAREAQAEARRLMNEARVLERKAVASVLGSAQVVCSTLAGLDGAVLSNERFDVALLDEATQATEPTALAAFVKAPTVILAGDPEQLSPTVLSVKAQEQGLGKSLFERLLEEHGESVKRMLLEQHRFGEVLMHFPSAERYGGRLRAHPSVAKRRLELEGLDAPPLLFLDTAGKGFEEAAAPGTQSLRNEGEAELIVARAKTLLAANVAPSELAIITPYRAQAQLIREQLEAFEGLEVDTVDAFQGREKDVVLLSLVRSSTEGSLGFLTDLRRINVALTRARRHLFIVGDSATLSGDPFYGRLVEYAQSVGGYRSAWEWT